jgi:hypothetical protein
MESEIPSRMSITLKREDMCCQLLPTSFSDIDNEVYKLIHFDAKSVGQL